MPLFASLFEGRHAHAQGQGNAEVLVSSNRVAAGMPAGVCSPDDCAAKVLIQKLQIWTAILLHPVMPGWPGVCQSLKHMLGDLHPHTLPTGRARHAPAMMLRQEPACVQ